VGIRNIGSLATPACHKNLCERQRTSWPDNLHSWRKALCKNHVKGVQSQFTDFPKNGLPDESRFQRSRRSGSLDSVTRSTSRFTFLAALLLFGCVPSALALRSPTPMPSALAAVSSETRVGGCDQQALGRSWPEPRLSLEIATGSEACGYESASGQQNWLNRDPIGEAGGINLYGFVGNNPVNFVDPDGLDPFDVIALNEAARRMGALHGRDWQTYEEAARDLGIGNADLTKGGVEAIESVARTAGTSTEVYVNGMQQLAVAGIVTKGVPGAAQGIADAESSWLTKLKRFFGKKCSDKNVADNSAFQRLLKAGEAIDKGDLTKAGRALQKRGSRPGSVFPSATGNPAAINQQGQRILEEILSSQSQAISPNRFGGRDIFDAGTGRGARYDANGNLMGFLEP
jgi:hypothetical protein